MLLILKKLSKNMNKGNHNEHLEHILKNTTSYQRMVWLKKAFEFWRDLRIKEYSRFRKAVPKIAAKITRIA